MMAIKKVKITTIKCATWVRKRGKEEMRISGGSQTLPVVEFTEIELDSATFNLEAFG